MRVNSKHARMKIKMRLTSSPTSRNAKMRKVKQASSVSELASERYTNILLLETANWQYWAKAVWCQLCVSSTSQVHPSVC